MKSLVFFTFLMFVGATRTLAQNLSADQIYAKTTNAIVTIYTFDKNDNAISQGSGVVLNQKGWVVTNYHVFDGADKIVIKHEKKIVSFSEIIAYDREKDILILKIVDRSFPSIPIGNSDMLKIGQKIYAIGSPLGFENTISEGIVSGLRQSQKNNFIQISAAISPGSSGGAVLNAKGELVAITTSTIAKGQNLNFAIPVNDIINLYSSKSKQITTAITENTNLYLVNVNGKFGYINNKGQIVINPQFDYAYDFSEGLAKVKTSNKYGFINKKGIIVINPVFEDVSDFQEGMAKFKENGKFGFINIKGEKVIKSTYTSAGDFNSGVAKVIEEQGFWIQEGGYINKTGKVVITFKGSDFGDFSEGLAAINIDGKYGYINTNATIVIKPQYSYAFPFRDGIAWVCKSSANTGVMASFESDAVWGCIDKSGNLVIPYKQFFWPNSFYQGLASVQIKSNNEISKFCYINKKGDVVIKPQFDFPGNFHEGLARVKVQDKYGYINTSGEFYIEPLFDFASDFKDGIAKVSIGKEVGYISKNGDWIWNPSKLQVQKTVPKNNERNGFKTLQIGDAFSKYSSSLTLMQSNVQTGTKTYRYIAADYDLYDVFRLKMDKILLTFNKFNLLIDITIIKFYRNSTSLEEAIDDSRNLDPNFTNLFGRPTGKVNVNTSEEYKIGRVWSNSRITVKQYVEDYGMSNGSDLKITITDNDFIRQQNNQGF